MRVDMTTKNLTFRLAVALVAALGPGVRAQAPTAGLDALLADLRSPSARSRLGALETLGSLGRPEAAAPMAASGASFPCKSNQPISAAGARAMRSSGDVHHRASSQPGSRLARNQPRSG